LSALVLTCFEYDLGLDFWHLGHIGHMLGLIGPIALTGCMAQMVAALDAGKVPRVVHLNQDLETVENLEM
jgi:hypothetical protein